MKCNLPVLLILAAAIAVLVFAWIAAAQGTSSPSSSSSSCSPCYETNPCGNGLCPPVGNVPLWHE